MSAIFLNKSSPSISYKSSLNRNDCADFDNQIIKLKLKKPKLWNWELTTSKSSPNIAFPRILLFDEKGELLADATESDCVFRAPSEVLTIDDQRPRSSSVSYGSKRHSSSSSFRGKTDGPSLKKLNECLNGVVGQLQTKGVDCKLRRYLSQNDVVERKKLKRFDSNNEVTHRNSMISLRSQPYESNTNEYNEDHFDGNGNRKHNNKLEKFVENEPEKSDKVWEKDSGFPQRPDTHSKESLKSFGRKYRKSLTTDLIDNVKRYEEFKNDTPSPVEKKQFRLDTPPNKGVRFDLQKSHSAVDIPKREKRKCRRSNTSVPKKFSDSILERMSAFKKRSSSSESDDCQSKEDHYGITPSRPKYFLRSCRAGTLIVCEESFRHRKLRRRPQSYPRISENEENDNHVPLRSEKVIQKYIYPGSSTSINAIEDILNNNNVNGTGRKSKSRYDDEIDKINKLIEKVSLPKYHQQPESPQSVLAKKPKFSSQETSIGSSANNSKSKTLSSDLQSSQSSEMGQLIRKSTTPKNGYDDSPEVPTVKTIAKQFRYDVSSPTNPDFRLLQIPSPSQHTSSKSSFNLSSDKSHSPAYGPAAGDAKIKRRKKAKELSRSVKESRLAAMDPSSDEDFDPVEAKAARTPRRSGGRDYRRGKVSPRNDNRLHERLEFSPNSTRSDQSNLMKRIQYIHGQDIINPEQEDF